LDVPSLTATPNKCAGSACGWPTRSSCDDYVIVASKGGAPDHPGSYKNLVADPDATIQVWDQLVAVTGRPEEKRQAWPIMTKEEPVYDSYQQMTERDIPLVILRRR
jgi:deazaflavin-dependent oxidoreductase (nitroreductase family)